ncbi:MAG: LysM peptidoglycan-binding domain-containing protein [Armatimonadetes bacterium]|nr:LysM peptidoglycan-binding domain-containing protein [Armatimonadota bacterium]
MSRQRLIDAGLLFLALLFLFLWLSSRSSGHYVYAVSVNGTPVVYMATGRSAHSVVNRMKEEKARGERSAELAQDVQITKVPAEGKPVAPPDLAKRKLEGLLSVAAEKYVILVENRPVVALDTEEDAMTALEMLRSKYGMAAKVLLEVPQFKEHVAVKRQKVDMSLWHAAPEEAVAALSGTDTGPSYVVVLKGDLGSDLARKAGIPFSELKRLNPGVRWSRLKIGDQLVTGRRKPLITVIIKEQVTHIEDTPSGKREIKSVVTYENGQPVRREILSSIRLAG